jgi:hypothetical protein
MVKEGITNCDTFGSCTAYYKQIHTDKPTSERHFDDSSESFTELDMKIDLPMLDCGKDRARSV